MPFRKELPLLACSALAIALLLARMARTGQVTFGFLLWNLILAWVPYGLSRIAPRIRWAGIGFWALWLLFFPNAAYIVTDFMHLRTRIGVPLWFDVALIASFALAGLALAVRSLEMAHREVDRRVGPRAGWLMVLSATGLSGLGIYIGRFLRWNSWDAIVRPGAVLADVTHRLLTPHEYPASWGVTIVFGAMLLAVYLSLRRTQTLSALDSR